MGYHNENMDNQTLKIPDKIFISEILRILTHDLKNDLAIIKESTGFIEDIITYKLDNLTNYIEKKREAINIINETIQKADLKIKALNRFAHRLSNDISEFNANEIISDFLNLIEKQFKRDKITINLICSDNLYILNNPLKFIYLIYRILLHIKKCYRFKFSIDISVYSEKDNLILEFNAHSFNEDNNCLSISGCSLDIEEEIIEASNIQINLHENGKIVMSLPLN